MVSDAAGRTSFLGMSSKPAWCTKDGKAERVEKGEKGEKDGWIHRADTQQEECRLKNWHECRGGPRKYSGLDNWRSRWRQRAKCLSPCSEHHLFQCTASGCGVAPGSPLKSALCWLRPWLPVLLLGISGGEVETDIPMTINTDRMFASKINSLPAIR